MKKTKPIRIDLRESCRDDMKFFINLTDKEQKEARLMLRRIDAGIIEEIPIIPKWEMPEYQKAYRTAGWWNFCKQIMP